MNSKIVVSIVFSVICFLAMFGFAVSGVNIGDIMSVMLSMLVVSSACFGVYHSIASGYKEVQDEQYSIQA